MTSALTYMKGRLYWSPKSFGTEISGGTVSTPPSKGGICVTMNICHSRHNRVMNIGKILNLLM